MMIHPQYEATSSTTGSTRKSTILGLLVGVGVFCAASLTSHQQAVRGTRNLAHPDTKEHHELMELRMKVASLEAQIKRRNRMTEIRAYKQVGPIALDQLPNFSDFMSEGDTFYERPNKLALWMDSTEHGCVPTQVPKVSFETWTKTGKFNCVDGLPWTTEIVNELVALADDSIDFSPHDYPKCVVDFYDAFKKYPIQGKNVLVVGSISPWVEAVLISRGAASIKTVDYNTINSQDPRLQVLTIPAFKESFIQNGPETDVIVSFSSIEHDGLGRYGDPLSPNGDMAAVQEMWEWLKPGGMLYLGIPIAVQGGLQGNLHRFFGKDRINQLASNWEQLDMFHTRKPLAAPVIDVSKSLARAWKNQPIYVWRKPSL